MIAAVIQRLIGHAGLRRVEGAIGLAAAGGSAAEQAASGAVAYVFPIRDQAGPTSSINRIDQRGLAVFGVLVVLRVVGDRAAAKAADPIEALRAALNARLVGWQPDGAEEPIEYDGGALVDIDQGELRWLYRYRAGFRVTEP